MKGEGGDKARAAASGVSGDNPLLAGTKFDPFAANGEEVSWASDIALPLRAPLHLHRLMP